VCVVMFFERTEKLLCEFNLFRKWVGSGRSRFCEFRRVGSGRGQALDGSGVVGSAKSDPRPTVCRIAIAG
jgi:hypothetical protein